MSATIHPFPSQPAAPDLTEAPVLDMWTLSPSGGCPTLHGVLGGLRADLELAGLSEEGGYARLRDGTYVRLGRRMAIEFEAAFRTPSGVQHGPLPTGDGLRDVWHRAYADPDGNSPDA